MTSRTAERLRKAIVTAQNDDMSRPITEKRARHIARMEAMDAAADELDATEAGIVADMAEIAALRAENERLREALAPAEDRPRYARLRLRVLKLLRRGK